MANDIQLFNFKGNNVRTLMIDGKPYFVGKDVAMILGYKKPSQAITNKVKDKYKHIISCGLQAISESGLRELILSSHAPIAEEFQDWVTEKVLPSLRKYGSYSMATPSYQIEDPIKRAERWIEEQKQRQKLAEDNQAKAKYIAENKERTMLGKAIEHTRGNITIGSLAKILKGNGININQNRLFKWLRQNDYLSNRKGETFNDPTQRAIKLKLFRVKETSYTDSNNVTHVIKTTLVTGVGQEYFVNLFLNKKG